MTMRPEALDLRTEGLSSPDLPVLVYRAGVTADDPDAVEALLRGNGWRPDWRDGV